MSNIKSKFKKGSALAYVLVIMSAVSIILVSMIQYVVSQVNFSFNRLEREKAFQTAEAGVFFYRWYLAHQVSGKTAKQIKEFWEDTSPYPYGVDSDYIGDFSDPEGGVIGQYQIQTEKPEPGSTIVTVKSTGWTLKKPNVKRTVQVRFRRPSWSEYSVLANAFMRFGEGTTVNGKIHVNQGVRFDGVANNVVSSSVYCVDDPDHSGGNEFGVHTHIDPTDPSPNCSDPDVVAVPERADVFKAGRQFPLPEVSFVGVSSDLGFMKTEAKDNGNGIYFNSAGYGRHIILKTDGTFDVCTVNSYNSTTYVIEKYRKTSGGGTCSSCSGQCLNNYPIPDDKIIFVEDNVWVEGKIDDKKVTIAAANLEGGSPANIYIGMNNSDAEKGHLLYTNFNGNDIIGLVAQNNISVVYNSENILEIDAALLAQSGRVGRDYYSGNYKNTITVNGSIATAKRYGFAYTNGTGYANRNLNFDNNLLYYPPPYFPTGTEYSIDLWDEL
ncbi:MAG: hypothetical protein COU40_00110 [Candidatus Moranbacteria bacterium CG10_big_fil_rev_8_21_14_0_10_35_21]|nr:MAG: hypothetical protein COU40_00110 [Candidatus Moranbacteria bacterium CG10_big_fil_rev_8_21_14_0_10_35_21]